MKYKDTMLLVLRAAIALIFIYHGFPKIMNPAGATSFFQSIGLPGFSVLIIGIIEVGAGLLLIAGLWYVWATYLLAAVIAGALVLVHIPNLFSNGISAGFERDVLIIISTLLLAAFGPGHLAWTRKN